MRASLFFASSSAVSFVAASTLLLSSCAERAEPEEEEEERAAPPVTVTGELDGETVARLRSSFFVEVQAGDVEQLRFFATDIADGCNVFSENLERDNLLFEELVDNIDDDPDGSNEYFEDYEQASVELARETMPSTYWLISASLEVAGSVDGARIEIDDGEAQGDVGAAAAACHVLDHPEVIEDEDGAFIESNSVCHNLFDGEIGFPSYDPGERLRLDVDGTFRSTSAESDASITGEAEHCERFEDALDERDALFDELFEG